MKSYDVVGIGNAIMDVIATITDDDLRALGVEKGIMQLIEQDRSHDLLQAGKDRAQLVPGGSVANTIAGIGQMGMSTAFIGRVADDVLGRSYADQSRAEGMDFPNAPIAGADLPTSSCAIFVTPDGERSMNTYLGISAELGPQDVAEGLFTAQSWLFLEGYLFDKPAGKAAFLHAAQQCRKAGGQSGIALSDPFCVDRHRADFRDLVAGQMDYVIGNQHEWESLYQTSDLEHAIEQARADCGTVIVTRSGDDAILCRGAERVEIPVQRIVPVDATGAGDQFAAGLIFGLAKGRDLTIAGQMGVLAASEVITHMGARPQTDLQQIFRDHGLL